MNALPNTMPLLFWLLLRRNDARGNITRYEYDQLDRLVKTTDAIGGMTRFAYDAAGNMIAVTDPVGNATQYIYDTRNRLVSTLDAEGGVTSRRYDFDNNLVSITDPVGNITNFAYDARARLVAETDPLGSTTSYSYDAVDNLTSKLDRNERVTSFTYDDLDRLVSEVWQSGAGFQPANVISYSYDQNSNLLSVSDQFSALSFTYDARDRVTTVDNAGTANVPSVTITYQYDGASNVTSVVDSLGGSTNYVYDTLNRVTTETQSGSGVTPKRVDFTYNEVSQFSTIQRFNDLTGVSLVVVSTYQYDSLNRLTSIQHLGSSNQTINFETLTYDAASRITSITDVDGSRTYGYDSTNQLLSAIHDPLSSLPNESYSYDLNGNRTISGYVTGAGNRLQTDGTFNYEYDNEGNTIRRTEIATGVVREYQWDFRNRLTFVTDKAADNTVLMTAGYTYDVVNRRIAKTVDADGAGPQSEMLTTFVYDREDIALEFLDPDANGPQAISLAVRNFHGPGIDQVLAREFTGGNTLWLQTNHLGSTTDVVDNAGALVWHITTDSFGNLVSAKDGIGTSVDPNVVASAIRYLFTGRERDVETGMDYFRARYYDPSTGKFVSEDPKRALNLYSYVKNDPTNAIDPFGLADRPIFDWEGFESDWGFLWNWTKPSDCSCPTSQTNPPQSGVLNWLKNNGFFGGSLGFGAVVGGEGSIQISSSGIAISGMVGFGGGFGGSVTLFGINVGEREGFGDAVTASGGAGPGGYVCVALTLPHWLDSI